MDAGIGVRTSCALPVVTNPITISTATIAAVIIFFIAILFFGFRVSSQILKHAY
jgi:hypothetical protein